MVNKLFDLTDKTALITGGGSGIGKAIATLFSQRGASVILVGRDEDKLKRTVEEISLEKCSYFVCDLATIESIQRLVENIKQKSFSINILVNNAGIYKENHSTHTVKQEGKIEFNQELITKLLQVNLFSYWHLGLCVSNLMKKNHSGSIINISSVNGICGKGVCDVYDMAKAAVNNLTLNQARQFASSNIRVNAICPSSTLTPMRDKAMAEYPPKEGTKKFDELEASKIPLKRLGRPEDIAYLALLLASDQGSYITGQTVSVDGGFLLTKEFICLDQ